MTAHGDIFYLTLALVLAFPLLVDITAAIRTLVRRRR